MRIAAINVDVMTTVIVMTVGASRRCPRTQEQRWGSGVAPDSDLAGDVADMSRHVGNDTTCRSNFGQMGPCRRHKI